MSARVTQAVALVLHAGAPQARSTQTCGLPLRGGQGAARVSQLAILYTTSNPYVRVTQVTGSTVRTDHPYVRATQIVGMPVRTDHPYVRATQIVALPLRGSRRMGFFELEKEGVLLDNGQPIVFDVETAHVLLSANQVVLLRYVHLDLETGGSTLTLKVKVDAYEIEVGTIGPVWPRRRITIPINMWGSTAAVRLTGEIYDRVTIYTIELDIHSPQESLP